MGSSRNSMPLAKSIILQGFIKIASHNR